MVSVVQEDERTLSATSKGQRVGTLTFFRNRWHFHPLVYTTNFHIASEADNIQHVVSLLLERLRREVGDALLLRTVVREDSSLLPILRSVGFRVQRHVYEPTLDVQRFDLSSLDAVRLGFDSLGYHIATLSELRPSLDFEEKFYDLFSEVYADTSRVMPATLHTLPREAWRERTLDAEDIMSEAFFIAIYGDTLVGFGNLFRGAQTGELETGPFGTARAFRHHHCEVMLSIKQREIAYAKWHGVQRIRLEIDADDPWTLLVGAELPLEQTHDYVSLVRVLRWTV